MEFLARALKWLTVMSDVKYTNETYQKDGQESNMLTCIPGPCFDIANSDVRCKIHQ